VPRKEIVYEELRVRLWWEPPEVSLRDRRTPPGTVPRLNDVRLNRDRVVSAASSRGAKSVVLVGTVVGGTCWIDDMLTNIRTVSEPDELTPNPVHVGLLVDFGNASITAKMRHSLERDFEDILETRVYVLVRNSFLASLVQPQLLL
jgi:hypothetical protein